MSLAELMPEVELLPRADKFLLARRLLESLEQQETESEDSLIKLVAAEAAFSIWSPFDAHAAADTLEALLKQEREAAR